MGHAVLHVAGAGARGARWTARSDQFSIAVVAYQMLTGVLPFFRRRTRPPSSSRSRSRSRPALEWLNPGLDPAAGAVIKKAPVQEGRGPLRLLHRLCGSLGQISGGEL